MLKTMDDRTAPRRSLAAKLAIAAAIGGMIATFAGHRGWGLFAGIAAIAFGVLGLLISLSPGVRGGVMSGFALVMGLLGVGIAVLGILLGALF
jgi:hypothetical protein